MSTDVNWTSPTRAMLDRTKSQIEYLKNNRVQIIRRSVAEYYKRLSPADIFGHDAWESLPPHLKEQLTEPWVRVLSPAIFGFCEYMTAVHAFAQADLDDFEERSGNPAALEAAAEALANSIQTELTDLEADIGGAGSELPAMLSWFGDPKSEVYRAGTINVAHAAQAGKVSENIGELAAIMSGAAEMVSSYHAAHAKFVATWLMIFASVFAYLIGHPVAIAILGTLDISGVAWAVYQYFEMTGQLRGEKDKLVARAQRALPYDYDGIVSRGVSNATRKELNRLWVDANGFAVMEW